MKTHLNDTWVYTRVYIPGILFELFIIQAFLAARAIGEKRYIYSLLIANSFGIESVVAIKLAVLLEMIMVFAPLSVLLYTRQIRKFIVETNNQQAG